MRNVQLILYRILTWDMEIPERKPVFQIWRHGQKTSGKYLMVIYVLQLQFGETNSDVIPKVDPLPYFIASTHGCWELEFFQNTPFLQNRNICIDKISFYKWSFRGRLTCYVVAKSTVWGHSYLK